MRRHLLVIDVQNDFCSGGRLAVEGGAKIIPVINKLSTSGFFNTIIATQDWHTENHVSFAFWPDHCVQGTMGAELHPELNLNEVMMIFRKGMNQGVDSYSAFYDNEGEETGLARFYIPDADNDDEFDQEFYIVGIATDVCVKATAIEVKKYFEADKVFVIEDACAAVSNDGNKKAIKEMIDNDVKIIDSNFIFDKIKEPE